MGVTKREEVKSRFDIVKAQIAEIEKKPKVIYITASKYIPSIGFVHDLTTIKQIVKAQSIVDSERENYSSSAKKLDLDDADIDEEEKTYLGFPLDVWDKDIKNRLEEVKDLIQLAKLNKAKKVLKKNLSADDKFELEMESIDDVLSTDAFNR